MIGEVQELRRDRTKMLFEIDANAYTEWIAVLDLFVRSPCGDFFFQNERQSQSVDLEAF